MTENTREPEPLERRVETTIAAGPVERVAQGSGPAGSSDDPAPSAPRSARRAAARLWRADRWIGRVTYGLIAAIVVVGAFLTWSYYADARQAQTQSNSDRAVVNLTAIVAKSPTDAQARVRLAEALSANGQIDEAVDQLQTALRLDGDNVAGLTDLGLIEMSRNQWSAADATWRKLVALLSGAQMSLQDQRLADVRYYLGTTLIEEDRLDEAVNSLKQSIAIRGDASPVHYTLAVAYQRLGRTDDQRSELNTVLAFDPKHAQANYDLGLLDLKASDVATAAELFRIAADNAPAGITGPNTEIAKLGSASVRLATAERLRVSDPARALSEARIAAAIDPTSVEAVDLVARLWELEGDPARAVNAWKRVLELDPSDAAASSAIARIGADGQ